ncbi:hypothetical protein AB0953_16550 [Streptomyces sp. NPDC046866]|uniref:hypothetical protein n=1 Tax=Streptomyces sp. NPDC046866 TaxID=3154921 RepID=UPI0034563C45
MARFIGQSPGWAHENIGDRIPHSDKVDRKDPARADILILLHRMELAGVEIDDRAVEIAIKLTRFRLEQAAPPPPEPVVTPETDPVGRKRWVYYVRCGHLIKIGTTINLASRFISIRPNEVLALEPGGQELETARHREFRALRASGEYFHPGPALQEHILALRAEHGPPNWAGSLVPDGRNYFPAGKD